MGRVYAVVLGTLAMLVVIIRGMLDASGVEGTLLTAMLSMVAFAVVGAVVGHIAELTVDESVRFQIEHELAAHEVGDEVVSS